MATTVTAIADAAFDAVAAAITDAVQTITLTKTALGAYNVATGAYAETDTAYTGRGVLDTVKPMRDVFPNWTVGPKDQLWLLEGLSAAPAEGDKLTVSSVDYRIAKVQDIVGAGTLYYVVAQ